MKKIILIMFVLLLPIVMARPIGDFNKDKCVDMADFGYFANHYGYSKGEDGYERIYDLNKDNKIDDNDLNIWEGYYGFGCDYQTGYGWETIPKI